MNDKLDVVMYRLKRADESFRTAQVAFKDGIHNVVAQQLYYVVYHSITALFATSGLRATTHSGVIAMFGLHFIKNGTVNETWGVLVKKLFNKRQRADYSDLIDISEEEIRPLINQVQEFRQIIQELIDQALMQ